MPHQYVNRRINEHGERLTKRQTQSLRSKLGRHAATNCASYRCDACPFAVCVVEIQADRIAANTCPYFIKSVLPSDPVLESEYMDALPNSHPAKPKPEIEATGKRCETCSIRYEPRSNSQRFCTSCASENRRKKEAERKRNKRLEDAIKASGIRAQIDP